MTDKTANEKRRICREHKSVKPRNNYSLVNSLKKKSRKDVKGWKRHRPEEMGEKQANPTLNEIGKEKGRSYRGNNKQTKNK